MLPRISILVLNLALSQEKSLPDQEKECCLVEAGGFSGTLNNSDYRSRPLVERQVYRHLYLSFAFAFQGQTISLTVHDIRPHRRHIHLFTNIHQSPTIDWMLF